ncbi:glycosyltransferase [Streptosporangium sp. NPDC051022]|uniref:glycosyltransferase n=1 Tax=Streptosporangium sp. NPDC051022 TaxID=3155752 RepID=UPI003416C0E5
MAVEERTTLRRVVLVINQLGRGGAEAQLSLLARGLRARGVETHVVLTCGGGPHAAALRAAGVGIHEIGLVPSPSPRVLVHNLRAGVRLVRLLRRLRPQVLHAFLYVDYVLGAVAARLARVPVVVAGRRSLSYFKRERRWVFAVERAVTRLTDHVVANAVAVAQDARTLEGMPADKLSVIYNGLPGTAFEPIEPEPIETRLPVVVCVANLNPVKGHRFLLEAAASLSRRGRPCTLVLAGEGPERGPLTARAAALGLDVRFAGCVTDVRGLLARADVVVLPSLSEGLSNSVMEAMAAGRPIVATAVGGTPELLDERGLLVPAADPEALADALLRLLGDPELGAHLGSAARAWAAKNLDVTLMVEEHIALYRRLLETRCAG